MAGVLSEECVSQEEEFILLEALQQAEAANRLQQESAERRVVFSQHLQDIEEVGHICDRQREHRSRGLYVTDISASEWCQQRTAFALSAKLPKDLTTTAAMQAGKEQHAVLEAETAVQQIEVEVLTKEDSFAIRLLNILQGLRQLLTERRTRELSIFGVIQGCWIWGVIDQLELNEKGEPTIVEQKTRFQPSLPSQCQKYTTALQVMLYRHLFDKLRSLLSSQNAIGTLDSLGLDPKVELDPALHPFLGFAAASPTLLTVVCELENILIGLPPSSRLLYVNYYWQADGELLEQEHVVYAQAELDNAMERHLKFWRGQEAPHKVNQNETWKCNQCVYRSKCWPHRVRSVPWQH